jgi:hypothetical protein
MPHVTHPSIEPFFGKELRGHVASINTQWNYGYIELHGQPEIQFIVKTSPYPGIKEGMPVDFTIDEGGAVNALSRSRTAEQGLAP